LDKEFVRFGSRWPEFAAALARNQLFHHSRTAAFAANRSAKLGFKLRLDYLFSAGVSETAGRGVAHHSGKIAPLCRE
jgi:hypothetical protein